MESELLQSLEDVGYNGPTITLEKLSEILDQGPKSVEFTKIVSWLSDQIVLFGGLDERVSATTSPEDADSFLLELSLFLKELGCVNSRLVEGNINERLSSKGDCIILLDYLITELMASKILQADKPLTENKLQLTINESDTAKSLKDMLVALNFPKPPENITADVLFKKLRNKLEQVIATAPQAVGKPLFEGELFPPQWEKLDKLQETMNLEYKMRREMLLKRLDVTMQSFLWSERIRPKEDQLNSLYYAKRNVMSIQPNVTVAHLLAAREDLAIIEKTSSASVRRNTRSGVNDVVIGTVPDRGGRPQDQAPPPPEVPSWQKTNSARGGRGGGGGGGGGRGGSGGHGDGNYRDKNDASRNFGQNRNESNRGGYSAPQDYGHQVHYQDNRGGEYQGGRGGGRGGNRGGGGGRGRGGRVQGGWNPRGRGGQHY